LHQIHFLLGLCSTPLPLFKGPTSKGIEENGRGEEKVKGKEGERRRERFGPPKSFGVAPPMEQPTPTTLTLTVNMVVC